jgi:hypothetical protein
VSNRVVAIRADAHAGVVRPTNLPVFVRPEGIACAVCALPLPASFGVRAEGARAAVRVYLGAASVVTPVRDVHVRAGQQAFVDCHERPCRSSGPVLFQPGEPFALEREHPKPLARTIPGASRPPLAVLAPRRSQAQLITSGRAGRAKMIAVVWSRERRTAPGDVVTDKGLVVWLRGEDLWRRAYARRYSQWVMVRVRSADVTRDGQRDFLVTEWNGGSGFCGPRRVLSRMHNGVRVIFALGNLCETDLGAKGGDLVVNTPVGPCPYGDGSAHCYGGIRHDRMRWVGRRFVLFHSLTICHPASLDARRSCTR